VDKNLPGFLRDHATLVTMDQLWTLATSWYATRLQENSRRPQQAETRSIFAGLGLGGDFWDPQSDNIG
jgi:hypothetical protein